MKTQQPAFKFIANLGDANPIEHGGFAVFVDETGLSYAEAREACQQFNANLTDAEQEAGTKLEFTEE